MTHRMGAAAALVAAGLLGGCVASSPARYEWGTYDKALNEYYRNTDTEEALVTMLEELDTTFGDTQTYELAALGIQPGQRPARSAVKTSVASMNEGKGEKDKRIAPGLKAELGFLKLERGDTEGALRAFESEKRTWPEAAYFMDVLIAWVKGEGKTGAGGTK